MQGRRRAKCAILKESELSFRRLFAVGDYVVFYLLEQTGGEYEIIERLVRGGEDAFLVAYPFPVSLVNEYDIFADTQHGVHVVGVDDCCYVILVGDVVEEFVNQD